MESQVNPPKEDLRKWSRQIVNEIRSDFRIVPLNGLKSEDYVLSKPIMILFEKDEDGYLASWDDVEAFYTAETEYEAINGLCEEIGNLYEDLSEPGAKLSPLPKKWLLLLQDHIQARRNLEDQA